MNPAHNIYIHVPFCVAKCKYCAFFSHACAAPDWDKYTAQIIQEIEYWARCLGYISVPTVFFGGGTPSMMPAHHLDQILSAIRKNFQIAPDAEITVEMNPGTSDNKKIRDFIAAGVNRISIGVQSFDDNKLKFLGRIHTSDDALRTIDSVMSNSVRVSGDFIYGLPGEDVDDVIQTCKKINEIGLTHCSLYELTIEPETPLGKMNPVMPTNDTMADMYMAISDNLKLARYEVSNYAVPGAECIHNSNIWNGDAYIGIGRGAAGRVHMNNVWYEQMGGGEKFQPITNSERAIERVITGLRTVRGVLLDYDTEKIINIEFAKSNPNMLRFTRDNRIVATDTGLLVLNNLITNLVK